MTAPAVAARHSFKLRLVDVDGQPLKNIRCDVLTAKEDLESGLTTDASGMLSLTIPAKKDVYLTLYLPAIVTMRIEVEAYEGAETVAGARARLSNLGYIALKDSESVRAPADDLLGRGLDRFRFANGIVNADGTPDGPMQAPFDAKTKDRLEDVHDKLGPLLR